MTPPMNQEQLAEFYEREKERGNPRPTDAPLLWAIFDRGYELKDKAKNLEILKSEMFSVAIQRRLATFPNTLTRVVYNPAGGDEVIHNYGTFDQYSLMENVAGPDALIKDMKGKNVLESLLGTQDVSRIDKVSQWINKNPAYFWRVNSKPSKRNEKVVRLYAGSDRLYLACGGGPLSVNPAFRVLRVE